MANQHSYICLFLVFFAAFAHTLHAYQFNVGGKDGWVLKPSENYNHWAERMRFQVNDTLLFKYKKGSDSVLVVSKDDYDKCNVENPILKLEDGNSVFKFERSGLVFFISGNKSNCVNGQKLIILVMAVRHRTPPPPPPKAPSPIAPPQDEAPAPAPSPPAAAPSPADSAQGGDTSQRRSLATPASIASVSTVSFVLTVCLGGFIISS